VLPEVAVPSDVQDFTIRWPVDNAVNDFSTHITSGYAFRKCIMGRYLMGTATVPGWSQYPYNCKIDQRTRYSEPYRFGGPRFWPIYVPRRERRWRPLENVKIYDLWWSWTPRSSTSRAYPSRTAL